MLDFLPLLTTVTTTVTGYNAPNAQNYVNGFIPLILPLVFAEIFSTIMIIMRKGGDFFVTLWDFGLCLGSSFGTLTGTIPLGMTILSWVILLLWLWTGGQGEGAGASGDASLKLPKGWD